MKAFLLIAGRGTRLRPLTDQVPKCLVPIKGEPLLGIWLRLCRKHGVADVLVNLHHLADEVEAYLDANDFGVKVKRFYEPRLLGSAGTVLANREFVRGGDCFFIIYGDNLTNVDLTEMCRFHRRHGGLFTMGLFRTSRPTECGIVELGADGLVESFEEKPAEPRSTLANGGIYVADERLFEYIPGKEFVDFGFDVLPRIVRKMYGYVIEEYLVDIGSPENHELANRQWDGL
jgi:mannose-1-phosphate guanylyltransferase